MHRIRAGLARSVGGHMDPAGGVTSADGYLSLEIGISPWPLANMGLRSCYAHAWKRASAGTEPLYVTK